MKNSIVPEVIGSLQKERKKDNSVSYSFQRAHKIVQKDKLVFAILDAREMLASNFCFAWNCRIFHGMVVRKSGLKRHGVNWHNRL